LIMLLPREPLRPGVAGRWRLLIDHCATSQRESGFAHGNRYRGFQMVGRISERELAIPALITAAGRPSGEISTTDLIFALTQWFEPEGEDAEILDGRHDTKFSQKVRNLIPHREGRKTIFSLGYAEYTGDGIRITDSGRAFISSLPDQE
jgi:hypothetical protein